MGWFRLFDRLRLRPVSDTLQGWALPGSRLRLTDPHLAAYFRGVIAAAGVATRADLYDIACHLLARSASRPQASGLQRFHLDVRAVAGPAKLLLGTDQVHAIVSWHEATRVAHLAMPGQAVVELRAVDLDRLLHDQLPISDIASLSAWLPDAASIMPCLERLNHWLSRDTTALIRLPGAALPDVMTVLQGSSIQPMALLPCEPAIDDPANPMPDILLCLTAVSDRECCATQAANLAREREMRRVLWSSGHALVAEDGLKVTSIAESRAAQSALPITLLGDTPPTLVGASLFAMQSHPNPWSANNALLFEMQAATLELCEGALAALPLTGPALRDPDQPALADNGEMSFARRGPMREVEVLPAVFLGRVISRAQFAAQIWPKLELAFDLVDREKCPISAITLVFDGAVEDWVRDALALSGFDPARVRVGGEAVLFRRLMLSHAACDLSLMRRNDLFDRFWHRMAGRAAGDEMVSFTQPRSSGRVMLLSARSVLLNADELVMIARGRQYRVLDPDIASARVLSEALRNAAVIVAESRAGIWAAFATSAAVGLLHSDADPAIPYAALHAANARGHSVVAMFGSAIGNDPQASFVVASDRFAAMLDRLEAASSTGRAAI